MGTRSSRPVAATNAYGKEGIKQSKNLYRPAQIYTQITQTGLSHSLISKFAMLDFMFQTWSRQVKEIP